MRCCICDDDKYIVAESFTNFDLRSDQMGNFLRDEKIQDLVVL